MGDNGNAGGSALAQGTANLILGALNGIATALKSLGSSGLPGATQSTAGSPSGQYMIVTANGQQYVVQLLNPK